MAMIIDRTELSHYQRVELYEEGKLWIVQESVPGVTPAQEIMLDAAALRLFEVLQENEDWLVQARGVPGGKG